MAGGYIKTKSVRTSQQLYGLVNGHEIPPPQYIIYSKNIIHPKKSQNRKNTNNSGESLYQERQVHDNQSASASASPTCISRKIKRNPIMRQIIKGDLEKESKKGKEDGMR